jgi:hypothetical protein
LPVFDVGNHAMEVVGPVLGQGIANCDREISEAALTCAFELVSQIGVVQEEVVEQLMVALCCSLLDRLHCGCHGKQRKLLALLLRLRGAEEVLVRVLGALGVPREAAVGLVQAADDRQALKEGMARFLFATRDVSPPDYSEVSRVTRASGID